MANKIEHIGIAVKDLSTSNTLFEKLLNVVTYKQEDVPGEKVTTSFFQLGNTKIELLASTDPSSAISTFIEKRGEGLHHIAIAVNDIDSEIKRLKEEGFEPASKEPFKGADNKLVFFFHPKSTNGILIEICQEIDD